MKRLFTSAALLSMFGAGACGDDTSKPTADTTADTSTPDTDQPDVAEDTAPPEDTTPSEDTATGDTTPVDPKSGLCIGVIDLCSAECDTEVCFEKCVSDNAASTDEATRTLSYVECVLENACTPGTDPTQEQARNAYQCEETNCLAERRLCEQGASAGMGTCTPIGGCIQDCEQDDYVCYRGCFEAATEQAAGMWLDLQYCVSINCYVPGGTPVEFETCGQNAIAEDGPCAQLRTACYGDTPGLQDISFRPVYGSIPPNPWPN